MSWLADTQGSPDAPQASGDRGFKRELGLWHLTAAAFTGVIGSGWLVGAFYASKAAGPASLITWIVGGAAFLIIAFVLADLGATHPESGALVRWPYRTNGRLTATIVGWGVWVAYAINPPSESAVVMQYAQQHVSGLYNTAGSRLTALGTVLALALMLLFTALNWFGVLLVGRITAATSVLKFAVPLLTLIVLAVTARHGSNYTAHGGFAPYGWAEPLSAISTAGIIYAYTGFQTPLDLSGEARDPHRDIPRAVILGLVLSMVLYIGLQAVFISALPGSQLAHGWAGLNFSSPFAQLAVLLNLGWLSWILFGDALLSPSGSALIFTASITREAQGMGKNQAIPRWFAHVHERSGIPRRALVLNLVLGAAILLLLPSWQKIIAATSELGLFVYSVTMVCQAVFRGADTGPASPWRRFTTRILAPLGFVVASLILYWAEWSNLRIALTLLVVALVLYLRVNLWARPLRRLLRRDTTPGFGREIGVTGRDLRAGGWLIAYLVAIFVMSWIGDFGGEDWITRPWDSVIVAVIALAAYLWGVAEGGRYLRGAPSGEADDDVNGALEGL